MSAHGAAARAAFFDVDGTIISTKSLISFIHYIADQPEHGLQAPALPLFLRILSEKYHSEVPRFELNRYYFGIYRGMERARVQRAALAWLADMEKTEGFYIQSSLDEIAWFKSKGYKVVLVSGSFEPLLAPLKERLGADDLLCTTAECIQGRYTGELIGTPCIGEAKREQMLRYALGHQVDLQNSWAFGDDDSDMPMLNTVGNGVMVGKAPGVRASHV